METKKLFTYLTCEKFHHNIFAIIESRYKASMQKDVIVIEIAQDEQIILFNYGIFVCWDVGYENLKFFMDFLEEHQHAALGSMIVEELSYTTSLEFKIHKDTIFLEDDSTLHKIALSHGLAQNIKLELFEQQIMQTIKESSNIPNQLAKNGKISLTKKELSQKIGELFLVKSMINLHYDLLDTPEFFWDYPEYEPYYEKIIKYLDLRARVEVLNKKVEVIQELLDMLGNEQNHKYSSFLEWIIIILILFEIVMNLFDHLV